MKRGAVALVVSSLVAMFAPGCGSDDGDGGVDGGGGNMRVDLDIAGCSEGVTGLSLLVRAEGIDAANAQCTLSQRCIDVNYSGASVDDIKATLRAQGFPLFDEPASDINRITVAVSATQGCPLGVLTTGCGSAPITGNDAVVTISLDCSAQPACTTTGGC